MYGRDRGSHGLGGIATCRVASGARSLCDITNSTDQAKPERSFIGNEQLAIPTMMV